MSSPGKRRGQRIWSWGEKIIIPCPLLMKCQFMVAAKEASMTQAEFGLRVIETFLAGDEVASVRGFRGPDIHRESITMEGCNDERDGESSRLKRESELLRRADPLRERGEDCHDVLCRAGEVGMQLLEGEKRFYDELTRDEDHGQALRRAA